MLYRFPKRKRWVTYQKTKKSDTKVGYLSLFLHPFHRQLMLTCKFDHFFLKYLLDDPQILNQNINRTLISKFGSFLDRKKFAVYLRYQNTCKILQYLQNTAILAKYTCKILA